MSLPVRRLVIAAVVSTLLITVALTAVGALLWAFRVGNVAYVMLELPRLALWAGPLAAFVVCVLAGRWVARGSAARFEHDGLALGSLVALLNLVVLVSSGAPVGVLVIGSTVSSVAGGYVGGWWAGRQTRARSMVVP